MESLFAPWRMKYIKKKKEKKCILCTVPKEREKDTLILFRGEFNYVVMNLYPYAPGHIMVSPYRHVEELDKMKTKEREEMINLSAKFIPTLKKALNAEGFNIGFNQGKIAGGSLRHVHMHVVPRWIGDTNFLKTTADTKIFPERVKDTYKRIKKSMT
jgi:ATP adenylyltransferase